MEGRLLILISLKTGDLLLVKKAQNKLSEMIIRGTKQTFLDRPLAYYHIGIVEKEGTDFFVLHATKDHGCIRQPLNQFISEEGLIDVYRKSSPLINPLKILKRAKSMLEAPYNPSFRLDQPGYYCSDYVVNAFKDENIFHLSPMVFGPNGSVLPEWQQYYENLDLPVPNGQLGSSPNSLISQGHLKFIGAINS